jgi:hypothetical protein
VPLPGSYPSWELGPDAVEDMIIVESFAPVLDLLDDHPNWTLTFEMQAYFVEVLAARHVEVLNHLRDLIDAGQVELVSFHYADQMFIAFPYEDWKRSVDRAHDVFAAHDLTLSGTVFCQEGQAGEGMLERMPEEGYDILAWPVNLWEFQKGEGFAAAPYYAYGDQRIVIAGRGVNDDTNEVYVDWSFMGDGELMATGEWDPYFPWFFHYREDAVAEYEAGLEAMEANDYLISSIGDYVAALDDAGIDPEPLPHLFDGTWQPDSTMGVSLWFGRGGLWRKDERDNHVRTLCYTAHKELKAAETIAAAAGLDRAAVLDEAWRQLHMAEVSDGSGINPYRGEVEFTIASAAEAIRLARDVIDEAKAALALEEALIDTAAGTVEAGAFAWPGQAGPGPFAVQVEAEGRTFEKKWFKVSDDPPTWRFEIAFSDSEDKQAREIYVSFPLTGDDILTTTALVDDEVRAYAWDDFEFEFWYLPAPIGLIGLGDGWWLVKDTANVHIAALIEPGAPTLRFEDLTAPWFETITWVFHVVQGDEAAALDLANRTNVQPTLAR